MTESTSRRSSPPAPTWTRGDTAFPLLAIVALCLVVALVASLAWSGARAQVSTDDTAEGSGVVTPGSETGGFVTAGYSVTFSVASTGTPLDEFGCESATGTVTYTIAGGDTATASVTGIDVYQVPEGMRADFMGPITSATSSAGSSGFISDGGHEFKVGELMVVSVDDRGTPGAGVDAVKVHTVRPTFPEPCGTAAPLFVIVAGEVVVANVLETSEMTKTAGAATQTASAVVATQTAVAQRTATSMVATQASVATTQTAVAATQTSVAATQTSVAATQAAAPTAVAVAATQTAAAVAATQTAAAVAATQTAAVVASQTADAAIQTAAAVAGTQTVIAAEQTAAAVAATQTSVAATQTAMAIQQTATSVAATETASAITATQTSVAVTQTAVAVAATVTADAVAHATASAIVATQTAAARVPTSEEQCRNGGYRAFGFANQGQCIAFVRQLGGA